MPLYVANICQANALPATQKSGADDGIPSIVGWDAVSFVAVMLSYKQGGRDSEVMVNVAQSLDLEQIEALAAHFATIEHQEE